MSPPLPIEEFDDEGSQTATIDMRLPPVEKPKEEAPSAELSCHTPQTIELRRSFAADLRQALERNICYSALLEQERADARYALVAADSFFALTKLLEREDLCSKAKTLLRVFALGEAVPYNDLANALDIWPAAKVDEQQKKSGTKKIDQGAKGEQLEPLVAGRDLVNSGLLLQIFRFVAKTEVREVSENIEIPSTSHDDDEEGRTAEQGSFVITHRARSELFVELNDLLLATHRNALNGLTYVFVPRPAWFGKPLLESGLEAGAHDDTLLDAVVMAQSPDQERRPLRTVAQLGSGSGFQLINSLKRTDAEQRKHVLFIGVEPDARLRGIAEINCSLNYIDIYQDNLRFVSSVQEMSTLLKGRSVELAFGRYDTIPVTELDGHDARMVRVATPPPYRAAAESFEEWLRFVRKNLSEDGKVVLLGDFLAKVRNDNGGRDYIPAFSTQGRSQFQSVASSQLFPFSDFRPKDSRLVQAPLPFLMNRIWLHCMADDWKEGSLPAEKVIAATQEWRQGQFDTFYKGWLELRFNTAEGGSSAEWSRVPANERYNDIARYFGSRD